MTYAGFAGLSRFTRSAMIDTMHQEYIRTARAKGVAELDVVFSHAFRNTLVIMVSLLAGLLPGLISGSLLIEYIFAIPGMGDLSMRALSSRDIPLIMALFSFSGFLTLLGILISDILYVFADPRISFRSRI
jgi:peptide/nickel transport system permease protein